MELFQPGQRIGAYRIIRQLGAGGMGQVYEAEHVALGVRRALKVFSTESEHSEFLRKRFVAEGRILADLQHPRIVRVYDLVVDEESGTAYFEMDLVLSPNGQPRTLADEQRDGVDEGKVASWFKDICEGLAYIHSQGIVHRDMSLDNILIGPDGHAVITDFGIAKIIDDSYRRKIDVTVTMVAKDGAELRMGKGLYMAPELKKQGGKVTFASDAYAVGVILFRLLSGSWYDVGTHLEDWLADFEYEWHLIIAQLCNEDPEKRLGEGGIGTMPKDLRRRMTSKMTPYLDMAKHPWMGVSIFTLMALIFLGKYGVWFLDIAAIYLPLRLCSKYRRQYEIGNWKTLTAFTFDKHGAWKGFNFVQWVETIFVGASPVIFTGYLIVWFFMCLSVHILVGDNGQSVDIGKAYKNLPSFWFPVLVFVFSIWRSGLRSLVSEKIRWAYKVEMTLLSISSFAFLIWVLYIVYLLCCDGTTCPVL